MRFNFFVLGKVGLMLCKGCVDNSGLIKDSWRKNQVQKLYLTQDGNPA